jgi:DNA helicase-2/ATP-dependent DNA helicase PcrA
LIVNWKDDAALRRIVNWPARGIGRTSLETLGARAFDRGVALFELLGETPQFLPKTAPQLQAFQRLIVTASETLQNLSPSQGDTGGATLQESMALWAKSFLASIRAQEEILRDSDDPVQGARKWENVQELFHALGQFRGAADRGDAEETPLANGLDFLREFIQVMTLQAQQEQSDAEKKQDKGKDEAPNQVTLLTLHGAKGLEFPVVFLVGMEEGFLPHRRTIEEATDFSEERRLCYVGITRAKDHLFLLRAKTRTRYGKPVPRSPSRFLEDIPQDLLVRVDESDEPAPSSEQQAQAHEVRVKDYLAQIRANLLKGNSSH